MSFINKGIYKKTPNDDSSPYQYLEISKCESIRHKLQGNISIYSNLTLS